jgi:hypothetical protein
VLACNDDAAGCGTTSSLTVPVDADVVYYIRIGSKANVGGTGTLTLTCTPDAPCPADIDGNGAVDSADLGSLLSSWGTCGGCAADLDGNGAVDSADLGSLLSSWGACP